MMSDEEFFKKTGKKASEGLIYCRPLEVGDIITCINTEEAIKEMEQLNKAGYDTVLHSNLDGNILRSYEITYIWKGAAKRYAR